TSRSALVMSVLAQPMCLVGSTYLPPTLTDMWTPGRPCGEPAWPTACPLVTWSPAVTSSSDRYETDTSRPGAGSMVTVLSPATEPAKVTTPDAGAATTVPTGTP